MNARLTMNAAPPTGRDNAGQSGTPIRTAASGRGTLPPISSSAVDAQPRGTNSIAPFSRIAIDAAGRIVWVSPLAPVPFVGGGPWNDGLRAGGGER